MKTIAVVSASVLFILSSLSAQAVPIGSSNLGREYMVSRQNLHPWSCGIYTEQRTRTIDLMNAELDSSKVMGYIGIDALRWMTVYAAVGAVDFDINDSGMADGSGIYALGIRANLIDHEILDPTLFENRLRLTAEMQYSVADISWGSASDSIDELQASLILGLLNDLEGSKLFVPDTIGIFVGPVYSDITCGITGINETKKVGVVAGIDVFLSDKISLTLMMDHFSKTGFAGGVHLRF